MCVLYCKPSPFLACKLKQINSSSIIHVTDQKVKIERANVPNHHVILMMTTGCKVPRASVLCDLKEKDSTPAHVIRILSRCIENKSKDSKPISRFLTKDWFGTAHARGRSRRKLGCISHNRISPDVVSEKGKEMKQWSAKMKRDRLEIREKL